MSDGGITRADFLEQMSKIRITDTGGCRYCGKASPHTVDLTTGRIKCPELLRLIQ